MSHDMREGPKTLNMQSGSEERDYLLSIAWLVPARLTYPRINRSGRRVR